MKKILGSQSKMDRLRNTGPTAVPHPLLTSVPYTVPLVCYNRLKRVSLEVKLIASSCNTRMRCACMSELACMRVGITFETSKYSFGAFSYNASGGLRHARINLTCSEK